MPAFTENPYISTYKYFIKCAKEMNCSTDFNQQESNLLEMNERGRDGKPGCLCSAKYVPCPCAKGKRDVEEKGICHCEVFRRKTQC